MPENKSSKIDFPAHGMIKKAQGRLRNAWQDYYNLFRLIEEKVYKVPPIVDFKDCKREGLEELKNYLPPDLTFFFNSHQVIGIPQKIDIPTCLEGKVGVVKQTGYFLEPKLQLTEEQYLELRRVQWIQWVEHIDMAYSEVLGELESSLTELECTLNKTNRVLNAKLRDKNVYRFWSNPDRDGRPLLESLIKSEGIENLEPYNKVENYKSCKSLLYSCTYTDEGNGNDVLKETHFDPEGYYNKILHFIKNDIFQATEKLILKEAKAVLTNVPQQEKTEESEGVLVKGKDENSPLYKKTPKDAKWQDLTMAFPNHLEDKVDITFKGKKKETVSLEDLGFVKGSTKEFIPNVACILLKKFAKDKDNNLLPSKEKNKRTNLHAQVKLLRSILKRCFSINGDPVPPNDKRGYRLQFKAHCYDKKGGKLLLNNLNTYFRQLKNETNKTKSIHDNDKIQELKDFIYKATEKILKTNKFFKLENTICTECYDRLSFSILNSDNMHVLCNDCAGLDQSSEYESSKFDNEIPRSN